MTNHAHGVRCQATTLRGSACTYRVAILIFGIPLCRRHYNAIKRLMQGEPR